MKPDYPKLIRERLDKDESHRRKVMLMVRGTAIIIVSIVLFALTAFI